MKKMFTYPGNKSRELKYITSLLPTFTTLVEPFAGAAALSFHLECPQTHLNEFDPRIVNFYRVCQDPHSYASLLRYANRWSSQSPAAVIAEYERAKVDIDKGTPLERAKCFLMYRQMVYMGMYLHFADGRLRGHPRSSGNFKHNLEASHHHFLKGCTLTNGSYQQCLQQHDNGGTFILVDPPYFGTRDYPVNQNKFDWKRNPQLHQDLRDGLASMVNAKWMVVHEDCPLYRRLYKGYNITNKSINYQMGNGHSKTKTTKKTSNIYITNY